jgi:hypothetical protein
MKESAMLKLYAFAEVNAVARTHTRDLRVLWALEEMRLPFEIVGMDCPAGDLSTAAYHRLSPFDQIPATDDDGLVVSESAAILIYLAKKSGRLIPAVRVKYAFIDSHEHEHSVRHLCKAMTVHPSSYYAWKAEPASPRVKEPAAARLAQARLAGERRRLWLAQARDGHARPGGALRQAPRGPIAQARRIAIADRLSRRPGMRGGQPAVVAPNHLQRQFIVAEPRGRMLAKPIRRQPIRAWGGIERSRRRVRQLSLSQSLGNLCRTPGQPEYLLVCSRETMAVMNQITLGLDPLHKKTRKEVFLDEMKLVVPWAALVALIQPHARGAHQALGGRPPFAVEAICWERGDECVEGARSGIPRHSN